MTILDLDPPRPPLRLVSSTGSPAERTSRYRTSGVLYGDARELYRDVLRFGLEHQFRVDPDAVRVILATKQGTSSAPARAFSAAAIWQLMFVDVLSWCRTRRLDVPKGCAVALRQIIDYLDLSGSLDEHSDSVDDLLDAIDECTGGWSDDPPRSAPTRSRRSLRSGRGTKRP